MEKEKMNVKKILPIIILGIGLCIIITVIILMPKRTNEELGIDNKISYSSLEEALIGYYNQIEQTTDENTKNEIQNKLNEYVLNDLQGYYYFREDNRNKGSSYMKNNYPEMFTYEKDNRVIYVKSKDEVYIVPYTEEYMKENNIDISTLDTIENSELYKYKVTKLETSNRDGAYHEHKSAKIELQSCYINEKYGDLANQCFKKIEIQYFTDYDKSYDMSGYFADMITENDDIKVYKNNLSTGIGQYREYYRNEEIAEQKNNEEVQKNYEQQQQQQILKNSIPQVGMTTSQVRQSKWGNPDKINKDTYSWGTTEQWVYNKYGYVYFKNGVVSSVSQR